MREKNIINKILSSFLAFVLMFTSAISPVISYAADDVEKNDIDSYVSKLPKLDDVKKQLNKDEIVDFNDIELETEDEFDVSRDFTDIHFDKDKVKVSFYQATDKDKNAFSTDKAGEYTAVYYAEPVTEHPAYTFTRKIIVKEKEIATDEKKETQSNDKSDEEKSDDKPEELNTEVQNKNTDDNSDFSKKNDSVDVKDTDKENASNNESNTNQVSETAPEVSNTEATPSTEDTTNKEETPVLEKSTLSATKSDELSYNVLYVMKHGNKQYINTDGMDFTSMVFPVSIARGLATYNNRKQKEFEVTNNFIAGMTYQLPIYDVDKDSDYYVAMPNVNLYSKELSSYDISVIYNNDYAEKIDGYHFENNILYIPKNAIDNPQNENPLYEGGVIAVQLNYAFGGIDTDSEGNADFGKTLPVQILNTKKEKPESKNIAVDNIFQSEITIPDAADSDNAYKKSDFTIYVNGMMVPISDDAWDYDDGNIIIHTSPAVLSNINIVYEGKGTISKALNTIKNSFSVSANAANPRVTTDDMKYYKNREGELVTVNFNAKNMYIGWRGYYESKIYFAPHENKDNYKYIKNTLMKRSYDEIENSSYYLYGGYCSSHAVEDCGWQWAIESYTLGQNKAEDATDALGRNTEVTFNGQTGGTKKTIYSWFIQAQNNLKKAENHFGAGTSWGQDNGSGWYENDPDGSHTNGIGGDTNFVFKIPSTVQPASNLISNQNATGYGKTNKAVKFTYDNLDVSKEIYFSAGCTHFDKTAGGSEPGNESKNRMYVSCLDLTDDYIVLCYTSANKEDNNDEDAQEASAVYKFKINVSKPVKIKKKSSNTAMTNGNAMYSDLSGAKYGIYETRTDAENNQNVVATLTTNQDGSTDPVDVSSANDEYFIKELKGPTSGNYAVDPEIKKITVDENSDDVLEFEAQEIPKSCSTGIMLKKLDKNTNLPTPEGDGTLAGAEFTVKYYDDVDNREARTGEKAVWIFKTDANGQIDISNPQIVSSSGPTYSDSLEHFTLPVGYYTVQETKQPDGYLINSETKEFDILSNGTDVTVPLISTFTNENVSAVDETPKCGGLDLYKIDEETEGTQLEGNGQGDASLKDIKFNIINRSANSVRVDGHDYNSGQVCKTIETDEHGYATTGNKDLPYGTYEVVEIPTTGNASLANASYLMKTGNSKTVEIREDGKIVHITPKFENTVVRGDVEIEKLDKETEQRVPLGKAKLVGTTFEITNKSQKAVKVDGKWYQPNEVCKTIRIEKDKTTAKTTGKTFPYGSYSIKEVSVGEGYLLTDTKVRTFEIREDGKTISIAKNGTIKDSFKNQVKRGDFHFNKRLFDLQTGTQQNLSGIPFVLESVTTHEKHVIVTAENGMFSTKRYPHSQKTNANDTLLSDDGNTITDESKLDATAGVWFGKDYDGNETLKVDDELSALPYDTYTVRELSCSKNKGMQLVKDFTVEILENNMDYDLNDIMNIYNPKISTVAKDGVSEEHFGSTDSEKIIDTVTYEGLTKGESYIMKGTLYEKVKDGEDIKPEEVLVNGKKVTSYKKFTAEDTSGTVEVTFTFPKAVLKGKEVVVFETCTTSNGKTVASHEDINDENQTVCYPDIETEAKDGQTETHYGYNDSTKITDTVKYSNLVPEKEYTIKGTLMNKETNEPIMNGDKEITAEVKFIPMEKDGEVQLTFEFPAGLFIGKEVVAFEKCYHEDVLYAVHEDIDDENQTVNYPSIGTEACDVQSMGHYGFNSSGQIVDTVMYKNLEPGKEYTMKGVLMDKETNKPVSDNGKEITVEEKFTPEEKDGVVEITLDFTPGLLEGKSAVVFEECYLEDKEIAEHKDIEDEDQTVSYPKIRTEANDIQSKSQYALNSSGQVVDTVTYQNLEPGKEYVMKGTLMDKATNKPVMDKGKEVTVEKKFKPEKADGSVEIILDITPGLLEGTAAVVFEECTYDDKTVAEHKDINDEKQTVYYPNIKTEAKDIQSQGHYGTNSAGQLVDTVTYKNLEPGREYTMKGTLMDKATGKPVVENGKEVTVEKKFKPEKADGSVEITLTYSPDLLKGTTVVVFEECLLDDKTVAEHKDIEDKDQSVTYPEIKTSLLDKNTGDHISSDGKTITVIDTVTYTNLEVGRQYTMNGKLMDKATGKVLVQNGKEVTASQTFTPEKADGTINLTFIVDTNSAAGHTLVAFEDATTTYENQPVSVAKHEDLNDADQTVYVPKISTKAVDKASGTHNGKAKSKKNVTINDEVTYKNLVPGKKYVMSGKLMDKKTGKALKSKNGDTYTVKKSFTPEKADGKITLSFKVPSSVVSGKSIVVFEYCKYKDIDVAVHADIKDKAQTVTYTKIKEKSKKKSSSNNGNSKSSSSSSGGTTVSKVKTGDIANLPMLIALTVLAFAALGGRLYFVRKKKKTEK